MIRVLWACLCRAAVVAAIGLFLFCGVGIAVRWPWIPVVLAIAIALRHSRTWGGSRTHGSARFASSAEIAANGLLSADGLILGRVWCDEPGKLAGVLGLISPRLSSEKAVSQFLSAFLSSGWQSQQMLRIKDPGHAAVFSRSGGGKGVSVVLPNLLSYRGSVVCIDPKCENFNISGRARQQMGDVVRLDPLGLGGPGSASFNPMAFINPTAPDFLDQCRDLANMLVVRQGTENDPYWNNAAEQVLTAMIAFVCACENNPEELNFNTVRMLISDRDKYLRAAEVMRQVDNPVVRRLGGQLTWLADKELNSVLSNVHTHTSWADSPAVAACLSGKSWDPRDLKRRVVSVFLVVPPDRMVTWAPLLRVWVGSFAKMLMRQGADETRKVLFILDEVAQLGRMQALEDAANIGRGYGIRLLFVFQSLKQVEACYGNKAGIILDNLSTTMFFALGNALETAEMLSRRIGDETIRFTTPSSTDTSGTGTSTGQPGQSINRSNSRGMSTSQLGRKLLFPDEILHLPAEVGLVFFQQLRVIPVRLLRYYNAPEFRSGRTGRQKGLGLAAGLAAACLLMVGVIAAKFVSELPVPVPGRPGRTGASVGNLGQGYRSARWQSGFRSPSLFPELEPVQYRQPGSSIFPELDPVPYTPPRRRPRRETNFNELIRID
jgi:type IV secretion system protein VirD4